MGHRIGGVLFTDEQIERQRAANETNEMVATLRHALECLNGAAVHTFEGGEVEIEIGRGDGLEIAHQIISAHHGNGGSEPDED